jgi:hypothetical protein
MRIQRYTGAGIAVRERAAEAADVITPKEAAAVELSKWGALADAFEAGGEVVQAHLEGEAEAFLTERQAQMQAAMIEEEVAVSELNLSPEERARRHKNFIYNMGKEARKDAPRLARKPLEDLITQESLISTRSAARFTIAQNKLRNQDKEITALDGMMNMKSYSDVRARVDSSHVLTPAQKKAYRTEASARELFDKFDSIPLEDQPAYLAKLAEEDLDPDVEAQFMQYVNRDTAMRREELQKIETTKQVELAVAKATFLEEVDATTNDEDVYAFMRENDIKDLGFARTAFAEREADIKASSVYRADYPDPTSTNYRRANEARVRQLTGDYGEQIELGIAMASVTGTTTPQLEGYLETGARTEGSLQAGETYIQLKERAGEAYLPLSEGARAFYAHYRSLRDGGLNTVDANNQARAIADEANRDVMQARQQEYPYILGDKSLRTWLEENADDIPGLNMPQPGGWWPSSEVPESFPPEMVAAANKLAESTYLYTNSKDAALQAVIDNLTQVWRATDINEGVQMFGDTDSEVTRGIQYMRRPPRHPSAFVREVLASDLKGQEFWLNGEVREFKPSEVSLYSPPIDERNEYGQQVYYLSVDGGFLKYKDDEEAGLVRWTYLTPPEEDVKADMNVRMDRMQEWIEEGMPHPYRHFEEDIRGVEPVPDGADVSGTTEGEIPVTDKPTFQEPAYEKRKSPMTVNF